jgi:hypothetical protein
VIRVMIKQDRVAPVPPVPPVAPLPPAPPRSPSRRYDITVRADQGGGKCEAEVRIDGKGIKNSRCEALDFELRWSELESGCYTYAASWS